MTRQQTSLMQKACNVMNLGSSFDVRPQVVALKQNVTNELLYQATNTNFVLTLFLEQIYKFQLLTSQGHSCSFQHTPGLCQTRIS